MTRARPTPPPPPLVVDAVIPAYNEAPRIAPVVRAVLAARCLRAVVVLDDGSTDDTAARAGAAGAHVVTLARNGGKGAAMLRGARDALARGADAVAFIDADLDGLRPEHVCGLVAAVRERGCMMACGLRDYGPRVNALQAGLPIITGERVVHRRVLDRVPERYWSGYKIEVALNAACRAIDGGVCLLVLDGVTPVSKHDKEWDGDEATARQTRMTLEVLAAMDDLRREGFTP